MRPCGSRTGASHSDLERWQSNGTTAFLRNANLAEASPKNHLPLKVKQVLVHGTLDDQAPFWLSEHYVEAALAEGDEVALLALEGDGHFEPIDPGAACWLQIEAAIQRVLQ